MSALTQSKLMSLVSDSTERFTPGIMQRDEDIMSYLYDIFKSLEALGYITLLDVHIENDESKIGYIDDDAGNRVRRWNSTEIRPSRISEVQVTFQVDYKGETEIIKRAFAIPKIVDECFFDLKGSTYFPIYQIADRGTSVNRAFYSVKTLLMPIRFLHKQVTLTDINGHEFSATDFRLFLFKRKMSYMTYYIAKAGLEDAVEYWGYKWGSDIAFINNTDYGASLSETLQECSDDFYIFPVNKSSYLLASKEKFTSKKDFNFLQAMMSFFKASKMGVAAHEDYMNYFGSIFTKVNVEEKCNDVLFSFERILDDSTKRIFVDVSDEDKEDIYSFVRWMINEFEDNRFKDNISLSNRRLQCWEYLLQPLLLMLSNSAYRIINTRNLNLKILCSIFNFSYMFLVKRVINNEFVRYSNCTNNLDLFGTLKATFKGAAQLSGNDAGSRSRAIHPSYVGNLSLITTSATDPGVVTTIVPFAQIKDGIFVNRFQGR